MENGKPKFINGKCQITKIGAQIWVYLTEHVGIPAHNSRNPGVIMLDRETGRFKMNRGTDETMSWKEVLVTMDQDELWERAEACSWMDYGKSPRLPGDLDVNKGFESLISRTRKAEKDGRAIKLDVEELKIQIEGLMTLYSAIRSGQGKEFAEKAQTAGETKPAKQRAPRKPAAQATVQ